MNISVRRIQQFHPLLSNKQKVDCHIWLGSTAKFQGDLFIPPWQTYTLEIDYPLETPVFFQINSGKKGLATNNLIRKILITYNKIYQNPDKYRVHKHDIDDLHLSEIVVNHQKKTISIGVDS